MHRTSQQVVDGFELNYVKSRLTVKEEVFLNFGTGHHDLHRIQDHFFPVLQNCEIGHLR